MRVSNVLLLAASASALSFPDFSPVTDRVTDLFRRKNGGGGGGGDSGKCDPKWNSISKILTQKFLTGGQCNDDARAAIRAVFHDCGAWETKLGANYGCDGSLLLELDRGENGGLTPITKYLSGLAQQWGTSLADMIVFAGSHATVTCPGGPRVQTWIGRKDSGKPAPPNLLPDVTAPAAELFTLFQNKGYDAVGLAALLGAHSTSKAFNQAAIGIPSGSQQDSTPGVWDVKYYSDTTNPPKGVFPLPSDSKLAVHPTVGKEFKGFVNNPGKWSGKFADALAKMELFGVASTAGMVDCTNSLPASTQIKRDMKSLNMFKPRN